MALSPSARIHDAKDDDAVRFPPVLDDVVPEVILADSGGTPFDRVANFGELLDETECIVKNLVIDVSLT